MSATIRSPIDVFLNAYPGIHSATVAIASHTDHPAFQGAALDLLFTFSFLLDGDLKMTRIMIRSADEVTRNWQLEVLHRLDMEHGVPEGEYKEVKGRFVEVVQSVAKGVEAVGRFVDDDIEYVDPLGAVIKGKRGLRDPPPEELAHVQFQALISRNPQNHSSPQ